MYLIFTSRKRENPLNVISLGSSGIGKTHLQEKVCALIPEEDKMESTSLTAPFDATNQNVTWTSANTAIALVNNSGLVTGVAEGTTTITATTVDGNKTSQVTVNVTPPAKVWIGQIVERDAWRYQIDTIWENDKARMLG